MVILNHIPPTLLLIGLTLTIIVFAIATGWVMVATIEMFQNWKNHIESNAGIIPILTACLGIVMFLCVLLLAAFLRDLPYIISILQKV